MTGQADFTTEYSLNDHLKSPRVPPSRPVPLALLGSILIVPLVLSVEHFERFGAERLMPVLNEMGITQQPDIEILPPHALHVVDLEEPARA